jgi:hypothetical protein
MFGRKGLKPAASTSPVGESREESDQLAAKIKAESAKCHPLVFAAKMIGFLSPRSDPHTAKHITVEDIDHPTICEARHNEAITEGLSFSFVGQRGENGLVYMYEDFAAIWPNGEENPRVRIPVEFIAKYVHHYSDAVQAVKGKIRPAIDQDGEQARRIREKLGDFLG